LELPEYSLRLQASGFRLQDTHIELKTKNLKPKTYKLNNNEKFELKT